MKIQTVLKLLFKVLAFGIFIYQMQNSIRKYIARPIVQITSTAKLDEIKNPEIYICQLKQFNYSLSHEFGYDNDIAFLTGDLVDSDYTSWSGKNRDMTFDQLKKILHTYDDSYYKASYENTKKGINKPEEFDIVFIAPQGFCMKLRTVKSGRRFTTTSRASSLFLVDPFWSDTFRLNGHENEIIDYGERINGLYEGLDYEVKVTLHDSRINDGQTCIDYENNGSSYGKTTENILQQFMLNWFGCILPWIQNSTITVCDKFLKNESFSQIQKDIDHFIVNGETRLLQQAQPPCYKMKFSTKRVDNWRRNGETALYFNIIDEVTVITDTYSYDMFSLVVDLGSALGLWLGISAVEIFGSTLDFFGNTFSALKANSLKNWPGVQMVQGIEVI